MLGSSVIALLEVPASTACNGFGGRARPRHPAVIRTLVRSPTEVTNVARSLALPLVVAGPGHWRTSKTLDAIRSLRTWHLLCYALPLNLRCSVNSLESCPQRIARHVARVS
jgi:hypothetical protein